MDRDVKDFLDFLHSDECNLWELGGYLKDKNETAVTKIFTPEQLSILDVMLKHIVYSLDEWHNKNDEESHSDIRSQLKKTDAHLRNHRHDYRKTFTGKAEY